MKKNILAVLDGCERYGMEINLWKVGMPCELQFAHTFRPHQYHAIWQDIGKVLKIIASDMSASFRVRQVRTISIDWDTHTILLMVRKSWKPEHREVTKEMKERTVKGTYEETEPEDKCEAPSFDKTNGCTNIAGSHTLSYVYPKDCQLIRNGGGEPEAFLCTISICNECFAYYKDGDYELENIEDISWATEYVLDYQEAD